MQISAILCFATCDWFCPMMSHIEAIFIEIDKNQMSSLKNIVVGTVYKPPNRDVYLFINEMDLILNKLR